MLGVGEEEGKVEKGEGRGVKTYKKTCLFPSLYRPTRTGTFEAIMNQLVRARC